jgi:hypothetical protein
VGGVNRPPRSRVLADRPFSVQRVVVVPNGRYERKGENPKGKEGNVGIKGVKGGI